MNAGSIRQARIGLGERPLSVNASQIAQAAEVLAAATRSWKSVTPQSRAEVDVVSNQLEGVRRELIDLRLGMEPDKK